MVDYIILLEKAKKLLAVAFCVFWLMCLTQVGNNKYIWAIGILLPLIPYLVPIPKNKPIVDYIYMAGVIIYIFISIVLTHFIFEYVPHLACCICLIAESKISEAINGLDKFDDLNKQEIIRLKDLSEKQSKQIIDLRLNSYKTY